TIAPSEDMVTTVLDFDAKLTAPAVVLGYRDGAQGIQSFAKYMSELPEQMTKHEVRLVLEHSDAAKEQAASTSAT
ncbi:MAG: hypothetical protein JWN45_1689, partial [Acidobacteriaceae bacterium]|nr:hypothetical protein [Acidobacteriaceae bacterium]